MDDLDATIAEEIVNLADGPLPTAGTALHGLAAWAGSAERAYPVELFTGYGLPVLLTAAGIFAAAGDSASPADPEPVIESYNWSGSLPGGSPPPDLATRSRPGSARSQARTTTCS